MTGRGRGSTGRLLRGSLVLVLSYFAALTIWWFAIAPIYPFALAAPLRALAPVGEGPTPIVQDVRPEGRQIRVSLRGYEVESTFALRPVIQGNIPLLLCLCTVGLFGVTWPRRLRFLALGLVLLYLTHLLDAWLGIRVQSCNPRIVGDIAESAFSDREAKVYDWAYSFLIFGRRFVPVAIWLVGAARFGVVRRLLG